MHPFIVNCTKTFDMTILSLMTSFSSAIHLISTSTTVDEEINELFKEEVKIFTETLCDENIDSRKDTVSRETFFMH